MDSAYQKFFKEHAGYPKFKSKHDSYRSYTTNSTNGNIVVDFAHGKIKLPKLKGVKAKVHHKYQVESILCQCWWKQNIWKCRIRNKNIGLDLGIKDLCITSDGEKYGKPADKKHGKKSSSGKIHIRCVVV